LSVDVIDAQILVRPYLRAGFHIAGPEDEVAVSEVEWRSLCDFDEGVRSGMVAARVAARALFARVGLNGVELPRIANRAPKWPSGWTGALSHCGRTGAAAISPARSSQGIGIDIEAFTDIDDATLAVFANAAEREMCGDDRMRRLAIFCGKEAAYKAFRCLNDRWLDPHDIEISQDFANAHIAGCRPIQIVRLDALPGHLAMVALWP